MRSSRTSSWGYKGLVWVLGVTGGGRVSYECLLYTILGRDLGALKGEPLIRMSTASKD